MASTICSTSFPATLMTTDDLDAVNGLVGLAKAAFYNLRLLRALEEAGLGQRPRTGEWRAPVYDRAARERLAAAHREGLFLQLRRQMPHLTDEALENRLLAILEHYYATLRQARAQRGCYTTYSSLNLSDVSPRDLDGVLDDLPALLEALAETFLREAPDRSLRVHSQLIGLWQDLILVVPPLLISSTWIYHRAWRTAPMGSAGRRALVDRMAMWLCDSTLPVDDDPALDYLCRQHGLDETHMHINGTTEAEKVWRDALLRPQAVAGALIEAMPKVSESGLRLTIGSGVERLLRQEDSHLEGPVLLRRLHDAAAIKAALAEGPSRISAGPANDDTPGADRWGLWLRRMQETLPSYTPLVVQEAWSLCSILAALDAPDSTRSARHLFWHYALLRAQFCRLLVQQAGQTGFDQFQYITLNELRETTEKDFAERFRQIERGQQSGVDFLEARFAPKADPSKLADLLGKLLRGYLRFLDEDAHGRPRKRDQMSRFGSLAELVRVVMERQDADLTDPGARRLRLGLVAHFIKRSSLKDEAYLTDNKASAPPCRNARMRQESAQQARVLAKILGNVPKLRHFIRGADAAANERHAGPEALAPAFRILRRAGMQRFTYHAGEDFAHLASGLRAVFEAVLFLDFDAGCRIGHGTAAGLPPQAWWTAIGNSAVLATQDRLDDLVFARHLLLTSGLLLQRLPLIDTEISRLAMQIWGDPRITSDFLTEAWKLRCLDPLAITFDGHDPDLHRRAEALLHARAKSENPATHRHFLRRHGIIGDDPTITLRQMREEVMRGNRQITVSRQSDVLDEDTLRALQAFVLKFLNQRRIAIETLPSSNVRISIHQRYEDHHAMGWLGLGPQSLPVPMDVVVGSDDPGIFATSLRMEYAHLLRSIREGANEAGDWQNPVDIMERVCLNAKRFRF